MGVRNCTRYNPRGAKEGAVKSGFWGVKYIEPGWEKKKEPDQEI